MLVLGMVCDPMRAARREYIRGTMLSSIPPAVLAFRFLVGGELILPERGADTTPLLQELKVEAERFGDLWVLPHVLDGPACNKQCSCIEKQHAWFTRALREWPDALWFGKTEDDCYINLRQLLFDLDRLEPRHAESPSSSHIVYGLINIICAAPARAALEAALDGDNGVIGGGDSFLGDLEPKIDFPEVAAASLRYLDRTHRSRGCVGAPMPFPTGPLAVLSADLTRALFTSPLVKAYHRLGHELNREADGCRRTHPNVSHSMAAHGCDAMLAVWLEAVMWRPPRPLFRLRAASPSSGSPVARAAAVQSTPTTPSRTQSRLRAKLGPKLEGRVRRVTLASMTWTKGHHYAKGAGGMGYVAPGASSVAVHALKRATSSDWEHVHNVSSAQARTRFPPLLWRYEMHESPPFRMAFTPLNQAVHS